MISEAKDQNKSAEQFADIKKEPFPLRYMGNQSF